MDVNNWDKDDINAFLSRCLERFGSMNKNDYEVALFHLLLKNVFAKKSDYSISINLCIPESKVKRLRYEESLLYNKKDEKEHLVELGRMLINNKYRIHNERILFAISDKSLRLFLHDLLMEDGRFADSSFNSNLIALTADDLLYLLGKTDKQNEEVVSQIRKEIKEGKKDLPKTIIESLKSIVIEASKNMANKVAGELATDEILKFINQLYEKIKK